MEQRVGSSESRRERKEREEAEWHKSREVHKVQCIKKGLLQLAPTARRRLQGRISVVVANWHRNVTTFRSRSVTTRWSEELKESEKKQKHEAGAALINVCANILELSTTRKHFTSFQEKCAQRSQPLTAEEEASRQVESITTNLQQQITVAAILIQRTVRRFLAQIRVHNIRLAKQKKHESTVLAIEKRRGVVNIQACLRGLSCVTDWRREFAARQGAAAAMVQKRWRFHLSFKTGAKMGTQTGLPSFYQYNLALVRGVVVADRHTSDLTGGECLRKYFVGDIVSAIHMTIWVHRRVRHIQG